nr:immunoglobulin heavy chain junction region [Macaca mulatta]MOX92213.1 immunoglobulin heavy chain junction region [Macaca mulatta]MOX92562.1 immunoglobulin heavy chain junction region [Macaca mulatta]
CARYSSGSYYYDYW